MLAERQTDIQTDRQTDRQTYSSQYFVTAPAGEVKVLFTTHEAVLFVFCIF